MDALKAIVVGVVENYKRRQNALGVVLPGAYTWRSLLIQYFQS